MKYFQKFSDCSLNHNLLTIYQKAMIFSGYSVLIFKDRAKRYYRRITKKNK